MLVTICHPQFIKRDFLVLVPVALEGRAGLNPKAVLCPVAGLPFSVLVLFCGVSQAYVLSIHVQSEPSF